MAGKLFGALLGAAFGSLPGGVSILVGANIGLAVGSMVDASAQVNFGDVGKLQDLRIGGSQYGAHLPRVWGRARLAGNIIWAETDSAGNHLVEHSSTRRIGGGKKGGGGKVTEITYTCTWAIAVCQAAYILRDRSNPLGGSIRHRPPTLKRVWFDDELVFDSTAGTNKVTPVWHNGAINQAADARIATAEGANAAGHSGIAYAVFEDVDVTRYGRRIPNVSVEIETAGVDLADVVGDILRARGVASSEMDVSAGVGVAVRGVVTQSTADALQMLGDVLRCYNFDLADIDGALTLIPRSGAVVATIPYDDLGASIDGSASRVQITAAHPDDLPSRVDVAYFDVDSNLQIATASAVRQTAQVARTNSVALPLALTASEARSFAQSELDRPSIENIAVRTALPPKYAYLTAGDVVILQTDAGDIKARITSLSADPLGVISLGGIRDGSLALGASVPGAGGSGGGGDTTPVATEFVVWSGSALDDSDTDAPGFYVAAWGAAGWSGATIYYSLDGGTTWTAGSNVTQRATVGQATSALSNGSTAGAIDVVHTVDLDLTASTGTLANASTAQVDSGQNHAVLGAEIIAFEVATLLSASNYRLATITRGLRRSTMTGHAAGDLFVVADSAPQFVAVPESAVGTTVKVKLVGAYDSLATVTAQNVVIAPRSLSDREVEFNSVRDQVTYPVFLDTAVTIYSSSGTTAGWVTEDITAAVPVAALAKCAILEVEWAQDGPDSGSVDAYAYVRRTAGAQQLVIARGRAAGATDDAAWSSQVVCPLHVTGSVVSFDYNVPTPGFSNGLTVRLIGYWGQSV